MSDAATSRAHYSNGQTQEPVERREVLDKFTGMLTCAHSLDRTEGCICTYYMDITRGNNRFRR